MVTTIPLFSAQAANAPVDLLTPIKRVLASHWYTLGQETAALENEFADYCGVRHCVSVANGTDALELGLRALGVMAGDQVLLTANAGFYGSAACRLLGAVPHYLDIEPLTMTMSVAALREAVQVRPKAVIVTHLYGRLAEIEAIVAITAAAGVPVIEDCAQAHGAMRRGRRAGSFGSIGCFSFYPTKNLGALGDGGAVVTNDPAVAARLKQLRQYGWGEKYQVAVAGGRNSRLDELQAAILREKLPRLDSWNAERREIARRYNEAFADLPLTCPDTVGEEYVAHLYVVRVKDRPAFRHHLAGLGIATDIHYPVADHLQTAYPTELRQGTLPVCEEACQQVVSLPCFPGLGAEARERVIQGVRGYLKSN